MRRARLVVLPLLAGLACAGVSDAPEDVWSELQQSQRQALAELYPPGTGRAQIRERVDQRMIFSIRACDFSQPDADPYLALSLEDFRERYPGLPPSCDRLRIGRTGWYTVLGGVRLYQDYVFYDEDERVLRAYRSFLRKSSPR